VDIVKHNDILGRVACSYVPSSFSFPLSPSFSFALRMCVRTKRGEYVWVLLVAANYELRLITMCVENRKFSGRDSGEENARGRSRQLAPDFGTPANYSKRMGLLLSGCSAIHAYNKPRLSTNERDRGGCRLMRVLIAFWAKRWCWLIIEIFDRDSSHNRHGQIKHVIYRFALLSWFNISRSQLFHISKVNVAPTVFSPFEMRVSTFDIYWNIFFIRYKNIFFALLYWSLQTNWQAILRLK